MKAISCFFLLLVASPLVFAAKKQDPCQRSQQEVKALANEIHAKLELQRQADRIPGLAYSVFDAECTLLSGALGSADLAGRQAIDPAKTMMRTASVSKLFTTLAVSQLIENGVLQADASLLSLTKTPFVRKILKYENDPKRLQKWRDITLADLMSHQSGISKDLPGSFVFFNSEAIQDGAYPSNQEFLRGLKDVEFLYDSGKVDSGVKYSNLGMNMLARIVEAYNLEGLSFQDYVAAKILQPTKMNQTMYNVPTHLLGDLMGGFAQFQEDGLRLTLPQVQWPQSYDGSIGVASTTLDLSEFGKQLLRLAYFSINPLLQDEQSVLDWFSLRSWSSETQAWGLGAMWQVLPGETSADPLWVGHTGTGYGERTFVMVSPERNLGIVIQLNTNDAPREKFAKIIADSLPRKALTIPPRTKSLLESARQFLSSIVPLKPSNPTTVSDEAVLKKYVGTYFADVVGKQTLTLDSGGWLVFYGHKLIAEDAAKGLFRFPKTAGVLFNSEPVRFSFDASGAVVSARVANVKVFKKLTTQP